MENLWRPRGNDDQSVRPNRHAQNSSTTHAGCPIAQSRPSNRNSSPSNNLPTMHLAQWQRILEHRRAHHSAKSQLSSPFLT